MLRFKKYFVNVLQNSLPNLCSTVIVPDLVAACSFYAGTTYRPNLFPLLRFNQRQ